MFLTRTSRSLASLLFCRGAYSLSHRAIIEPKDTSTLPLRVLFRVPAEAAVPLHILPLKDCEAVTKCYFV